MFLKSLMFTKAAFILPKHSKSSKTEILVQFKITIFYLNIFYKGISFLWCKAELSASSLSSVSNDPSEIILIWQFAG